MTSGNRNNGKILSFVFLLLLTAVLLAIFVAGGGQVVNHLIQNQALKQEVIRSLPSAAPQPAPPDEKAE